MNKNQEQQLEPQEIASTAALALHFDLIDTADVVAWADSVIAKTSEPPYWAVELALAKPENVQELLCKIPGPRRENLALQTLVALLRLHWNQNHMSVKDICVIGRALYFISSEMESEDTVWGIVLDDEYEAFEEGSLAEKDLQEAITEHLSPYASFESLIPTWMIRPLTKTHDNRNLNRRIYPNAYKAAQDILTHEWDPIGIGDNPMAQDEYNAYIPDVLRIIANGCNEMEIADYLDQIERDRMGLPPLNDKAKRNLKIAQRLQKEVRSLIS